MVCWTSTHQTHKRCRRFPDSTIQETLYVWKWVSIACIARRASPDQHCLLCGTRNKQISCSLDIWHYLPLSIFLYIVLRVLEVVLCWSYLKESGVYMHWKGRPTSKNSIPFRYMSSCSFSEYLVCRSIGRPRAVNASSPEELKRINEVLAMP